MKQIPWLSIFYSRVVSRGNKICPHLLCLPPKRSEFNFSITKHVRIRRSTDFIFGYHLIHYAFFILLFKIKKEEGNIKRDCHSHGITPFIPPIAGQEIRLPDFDKNTGNIISGFFKKRRADRGIYPSGKSNKNTTRRGTSQYFFYVHQRSWHNASSHLYLSRNTDMVLGLGGWLLQSKPTRDYLWDVSVNRQIHKYPSPNQPAKACQDQAVSKEYLKLFPDLLWFLFLLREARP